MANKGFISSPEAFIRQIRQNLTEGRYTLGNDGFSIVKELVQNADDAGATKLHIGVHDNLSGSDHPLLRSPGLFVVNDGPFEPHDADNLRRFGINTKALDSAKIGKFGLGLKSIFHLCEAFFFLGQAGSGPSARLIADVLNPWSGEHDDGFHPDWDVFSSGDRNRILAALAPFYGNSLCFCLWIPLRQRSQLAGNEPISHFYPGDTLPDWLTSRELPTAIARLLPLLSTLVHVSGWSCGQRGASQTFEVRLGATAQRRQPFEQIRPKSPYLFGGDVAVARPSEQQGEVAFVGVEHNPADTDLAALEKTADWPSDLGRDRETGQAKIIREKAFQHAGVCLSTKQLLPGETGRLSISWAVFLPLGEPEVLPLISAKIEVSLYLHGYFFVDAGRNHPVGLLETDGHSEERGSDEQLRRRWNRRLAKVGTLPLIPRILSRLHLERPPNVRHAEMLDITRAIQTSQFFAAWGPQVCHAEGWACLYAPGCRQSWTLFSATDPVFELPACSEKALPFEVFPALDVLVRNRHITAKDLPRLVPSDAVRSWDRDDVERLFASVPHGILLDEQRADYLVRFLDLLAEYSCLSRHAEAIARIARTGMAHMGMQGAHCDHVRRLIERIPPERRLPIQLAGETGDALFKEINRYDVGVVFVPRDCDATSPGNGRLATDDAVKLLTTLAARQQRTKDAGERESISVLSAQLLQRGHDRDEVLRATADLRLFLAKKCRDKKDTLVTLNELEDSRRQKTLFVSPSPRAYSLQRALSGETVLLISKECFETVFPDDQPSQCTQALVLDTLARSATPILASPADRIELFTSLLGFRVEARQAQTYTKCLRYLLHGEPTQFHTVLPLLVGTPGQSDVWRRVTRISLMRQTAEWRLVDPHFARLLSEDDKESLGIRDIGPASSVALIGDVGPETFRELEPSPVEYSTLLKDIEDDDLCRRMPIHTDLAGTFVAIDQHSYWQSDITVPAGLAASITILRKSENDAAWRRQLVLTRQLDTNVLIDIVLSHKEPGRYWMVIMDALAEKGGTSPECASRLRSTPWLPTCGGAFVQPQDIIDLPHLVDEVARLVAASPNIFYEPGMLLSELRDHPAYPDVRDHTFPDAETSLSMLGELLVDNPSNHIGPVRADHFHSWCDVVGDVPDSVLGCAPLIQRAGDHYPMASPRILEQLAKPAISSERIKTLLAYFREAHQRERTSKRKAPLVRLFNEYLRIAVQQDGYDAVVCREELPNQLGEWRSSGELCCKNDGVSQTSIVDVGTEEALAPAMPTVLQNPGIGSTICGLNDGHEPDWATIQPELDAASERLRAYFTSWQDIVPNEQIGGFLALLGDAPGVHELARQFLGKNRTIDETRIKFGLPSMRAGNEVEDGLTMMTKQRVVVELVQDATVSVLNLRGQVLLAPRSDSPQNIFVGYGKRNHPFPHSVVNGTRVICFRLNVIDPRRQNPADLSRWLRDSAVKFIGEAYNSYESQTTFAAAWDELSESDQLDISIAQERVVENGFLILDQLGLRSDARVAAVLDKWDAAQRLLAEQRAGSASRHGSRSRNADAEMREAKSQLRLLLEDDCEVQDRVLEAIRARIGEYYQYTKESLPFEIFQNADDASVEMIEHFDVSEEARQAATTFQVFTGPSMLTLVHFGRRINQYPLDKPDVSMGFDNDLWRMLVLSLSNKGHGGGKRHPVVTGKFGLGFKSSYLVSGRPRILSGRLAFEVVGAMYPRRLIGEERSSIDECRAAHLGGNPQATILQLPLTDATDDEVLRTFRSLAHLIVVFARRIRCCIFNDGDIEVKWEPKVLPGVVGCYTGVLSRATEAVGNEQPTRALLFESGHGAALFVIGPRTFGAFESHVPTIWVTAPTLESLDLGFVLNGPFALDIGRAQLAREFAQNRDIATRLGEEIGTQLCHLFERSTSAEEWAALGRELRLAADANRYAFWDSLFSLIGNSIAKRANHDQPADAVVREVFWTAPNRGAARLYSTCRALPTRLPGKFERLVSVAEIRHAVTGILADDPEVFSIVSSWDSFLEHAAPGSVVSSEHIFEPIKKLAAPLVAQVRPLTLLTVLEWEFRYGNYADPQTAGRLGQAISKGSLDLMRDNTERNGLRDVLDTVEFKGADGQYHPAKQLLLGHCGDLDRDDRREDERLRAEFAPSSRVLSPEYEGPAVAFFDACRETLEAPARLLAEWVVEAQDLPRQEAALRYLAHGELSTGVIEVLKQRGLAGTWLSDLTTCEAFWRVDVESRPRLHVLLPESARPKYDRGSLVADSPTPAPVDAATALSAIHEWWIENRDRPQPQFHNRSYIEEYERRTYPRHVAPAHLPFNDPTDVASRKDWMTLFILGLVHTMGGFQREQHGSFLAFCEERGALDVFAGQDTDAKTWISLLENYFEAQTDNSPFLHWMRQFVGIFAVSRRLDDYIESFCAIQRHPSRFPLTAITEPRTDNRAPVSAPPISRVLGMGACFVVRELVRLGVITNDRAFEHAFVPVKGVRDVLEQIGATQLTQPSRKWEISARIYAYVVEHLGTDKATFCRDFDIPFQFLAENRPLQMNLLKQEVQTGEEDESDLLDSF